MAWVKRLEGPRGRRYRVGWRDLDGVLRSKTFKKRADADTFKSETETALRRRTYIDPKKGEALFGDYFARHLGQATNLQPATLSRYRTHGRLYLLPVFGKRQLASITSEDVKNFNEAMEKERGAATVEAVFWLLRRVLRAAYEDELIGRNPAVLVRVKRAARKDIRVLGADQLMALADAIEDRYRALILMLGFCGLRIGEAFALRVRDVDLRARRLHVSKSSSEIEGEVVEGPTKTAKPRSVPMPAFFVDDIAQHINEFCDPLDREARVFTSSQGDPMRQHNFRRREFARACKSAGITPPIRVHELRHTAVSLAIQAGAHPSAIKELVGHSTITTTLNVYGKVGPSLAEEAAEKLDAVGRAARAPKPAEVVQLRPRERDSRPQQ